MAALRSSKEFKELAARLTERGKKKMQIIAAAMHKLVRIEITYNAPPQGLFSSMM